MTSHKDIRVLEFLDWLVDFSPNYRSCLKVPASHPFVDVTMPFYKNWFLSWDQGSEFALCMKKRLQLVCLHLKNKSSYLVKSITTAGDWGVYSEITALYFLISNNLNIEPFVHMEKYFSFKSGEGSIEKDGIINDSLGEFCSFFEIKTLQDRNEDLLRSIKKEVHSELYTKNLDLIVDGAGDGNHLLLGENFHQILKELRNAIENGKEKVIDIPGLQYRFRLIPEAPVKISEKSFNPYRFAENTQGYFLKTWKQIHKEKPNITIYVDMPWMGSLPDFINSRKVYYRTVIRRVFVGLTKEERLLKEFVDDDPIGGITASDIAKRLSAILILYDQPYDPKFKMESNLFLNPNAIDECKLNDYNVEKITDFNLGVFSDYEDFQHDNY